jgi:hypothetical protein
MAVSFRSRTHSLTGPAPAPGSRPHSGPAVTSPRPSTNRPPPARNHTRSWKSHLQRPSPSTPKGRPERPTHIQGGGDHAAPLPKAPGFPPRSLSSRNPPPFPFWPTLAAELLREPWLTRNTPAQPETPATVRFLVQETPLAHFDDRCKTHTTRTTVSPSRRTSQTVKEAFSAVDLPTVSSTPQMPVPYRANQQPPQPWH